MLNFSIDDRWIAQLLTLPTQTEQFATLASAQFFDEAGLTKLLDYADSLAQRNPDQVRQLTVLCQVAAQQLSASTLIPRTLYLRAQSHAINGELPLALELVEAARTGFLRLGLETDAMRTYVGEMRVLGELGRFQEALNAGEVIILWLETNPSSADAERLLALVKTQQGICYNQLGRFQEALSVFAIAEAIYERFAMQTQNAAVKNSRGLTLLYLGRVSEALQAFSAALHIQIAEDLPLLQAHTQSNLGEAHLLLGNYRSALAAFEQARNLLVGQSAMTDEQINLRQIADAYLALNLFDEALSTYREVIHHLGQAGMEHERAWALWGMGAVLAGQQQSALASEALAESAALFARVGNAPLLASVRLEQSALLEQQGDRGRGLALAFNALTSLSAADWPVQQFFAHLRMVDLTLPDVDAAEAHLQSAQKISERLALPHLRYRLLQRWARLRLLQQQTEVATTILEAAVEEIEQLRNTLPLETMRISFLRDKLTVYETLVQLYLEREGEENLQRSFDMAERARSRTLIERMVGMIEIHGAATHEPDLAQRLQILQGDLNAIYNRLLNQDQGDELGDAAERSLYNANLQSRAVLLEQEMSRLRLLIVPTQPATDFFAPLPLQAIQQELAADLLVITYYLIDEEIVAFVLARSSLQVVRHLSTRTEVEQLLHRLYDQWQRFRVGRSFVGQHQSMLLQSTQRILQALYQELFAPLEPLLGTYLSKVALPQNLTIVPHGLLHQVPFQALYDGQVSLIERFIIGYAPSVTALIVAQAQINKNTISALVMGVSGPDLPAIENEVAQVAAQFVNAAVHLNEQATIAVLQRQSPAASVLHLACHAIFRADNPMFSALKLGDGWLTAIDVAQIQLHCALVVLSACESGRGHTVNGDEILGLARAFLGAGSATIVASQWMVQDEAAATLMTEFYRNLAAQKNVVSALRTAQLLIKKDLPHPYYWAPFIVIGNRATVLD